MVLNVRSSQKKTKHNTPDSISTEYCTIEMILDYNSFNTFTKTFTLRNGIISEFHKCYLGYLVANHPIGCMK